MPSMLGHQIGLLTLLWRDKDKATQSRSRQCVCLLLQLLIQQKGELWAGRRRRVGPLFPGDWPGPAASLGLPGGLERRGRARGCGRPPTECPATGSTAEFTYLNKMRSFEVRAHRESETRFFNLVKVGPMRAGPGGSTGAQSPKVPKIMGPSWSTRSSAHSTDGADRDPMGPAGRGQTR